MRDSVAQAHLLIGATLRDPQRQREGRVVGVDQTRDVPALWLVWSDQSRAERVTLSRPELSRLVEGCAPQQRAAPAIDDDGGRRANVAAGADRVRRSGSEVRGGASPAAVALKRTGGE
ncbi:MULTISPECIES: hypothetical protein [unclassified Modicisalibacter]|uniref:hypothetical protein n=1 Tax=unclassified Modicisalibacter TaxID=2679913 RepID=UPI001CCB62F4|nr:MULTISPECIES: hypothetical protein [unclassified Modicisalibacter]MBZ9557714.1 hypothetical protein [Modicisalibacter sp. R2A 31.J]MBZ9573622.1 hypothetical protein [Modicisalibacter sp. MOD 31.J]